MAKIDEIAKEVTSLKKEVETLKKNDARKERIIRKLSLQLRKAVKTIRTVKESSRRNSGAIDALKGAFRNMRL